MYYILLILVAFSHSVASEGSAHRSDNLIFSCADHDGTVFSGLTDNQSRDSLNAEFAGSWPFGIAYNVAVDPSRGLTFCSAGAGVYIFDSWVPTPPVPVSERIHARDTVLGLFYEESTQRLYLAVSNIGLEIWDVQDVENPSMLGTCLTPSLTISVVASDGYAYIADALNGVRVIDVSAPSNPVEVGFLEYSSFYLHAVTKTGNYLYLAAGLGGLRVIDVSTPADPTEVGSCVSSSSAEDVATAGQYAFIANGYGVQVIDISSPSNPTAVGSCYLTQDARGVEVSGDYAYIANASDGLSVIDVSTPSNPIVAGNYDTSGNAGGIAVSGNSLFVSDQDGLWAIDVSTPTAPVLINTFNTPGYARGLAVDNGLAYVAGQSDGLRIIDVSNPSVSCEVGYCDTPLDAIQVEVLGDYAYVVDINDGLHIIDISNSSTPVEVGYCETPGDYTWDISISGDYAFVANYDDGLRVIDISNPLNPTEVGYYGIGFTTTGVASAGNFVYTTGNGLRILDVSTPSNPVLLGVIYMVASRVEIVGNYAYVIGSQSLSIIDVSSPSDPVQTGSCSFTGTARRLAVSGDFAYVTVDGAGIRLINISNPEDPFHCGHYTPAFDAEGVVFSDNLVFTACGTNGLQIFDFSSAGFSEEENMDAFFMEVTPNPSNGNASVHFQLSQQSNVRLNIYDMSGRLVAKPFSSIYTPGQCNIELGYLPSGIYIASLNADGKTASRQFAVLR